MGERRGSWSGESSGSGRAPGCPDERTLLSLVNGTLAPGLQRATEDHAGNCAECAQLVAALRRAAPLHAAATGLADNAFLGGAGAAATQPMAPTRVSPVQHKSEAEAASPVAVGETVAGKYRVDSMLGVGGMGVVVAATHMQLGQKVAIKFMRPDASREPEAAARFLREARAAVQIQGEHVARVMDVATLDSGPPYMVMEFLRGTDLAELLRVRGPLPIDDAVDYLLQACEAIAEAHTLGIVHRDLKPANLFLTVRPDGSPLLKVLDFGISKHLGLAGAVGGPQLTTGHAIMGSPRYMSPEQMRSTKSVDARTDVWALGCILFELLTARPTFDGDTAPDLAAAITAKPTPPIRALRPDVPPDIERAINRCLEKDVTRRMASVAELARALAPLAPRRAQVSVERILRMARHSQRPPHSSLAFAATVASSPTPALAPGAATDQSFARSAGQTTTVKGGATGLVLVLAGLIGAVIGVAIFFYVRGGIRGAPQAAASSVAMAPSATVTAGPPPEATTATAPAVAPVASAPPAATGAANPTAASTPILTAAAKPAPPATTKRPAKPAAPRGAAPPAPGVSPLDVNPNDNGLLDRK